MIGLVALGSIRLKIILLNIYIKTYSYVRSKGLAFFPVCLLSHITIKYSGDLTLDFSIISIPLTMFLSIKYGRRALPLIVLLNLPLGVGHINIAMNVGDIMLNKDLSTCMFGAIGYYISTKDGNINKNYTIILFVTLIVLGVFGFALGYAHGNAPISDITSYYERGLGASPLNSGMIREILTVFSVQNLIIPLMFMVLLTKEIDEKKFIILTSIYFILVLALCYLINFKCSYIECYANHFEIVHYDRESYVLLQVIIGVILPPSVLSLMLCYYIVLQLNVFLSTGYRLSNKYLIGSVSLFIGFDVFSYSIVNTISRGYDVAFALINVGCLIPVIIVSLLIIIGWRGIAVSSVIYLVHIAILYKFGHRVALSDIGNFVTIASQSFVMFYFVSITHSSPVFKRFKADLQKIKERSWELRFDDSYRNYLVSIEKLRNDERFWKGEIDLITYSDKLEEISCDSNRAKKILAPVTWLVILAPVILIILKIMSKGEIFSSDALFPSLQGEDPSSQGGEEMNAGKPR